MKLSGDLEESLVLGERLAADVLAKAGLPTHFGPFIRNGVGEWLPLPGNHRELGFSGVLALLPTEFKQKVPLSLATILELVRDRKPGMEWRAGWVLHHGRAIRIAVKERSMDRAVHEALRFEHMLAMLRPETGQGPALLMDEKEQESRLEAADRDA